MIATRRSAEPATKANAVRAMCLMFFAVAIPYLTGGCCAPGVVRIAPPPSLDKHQAPKNKKVALVVRDMRPTAIQDSNMCGVNHQTAFVMPVAPIFLAHAEHLDAVVARHASAHLENSGFDVVSCLPEISHRASEAEFDVNAISPEAKKAAWALKDSQDISKSERKLMKKAKKAGSTEKLVDTAVSPWGPKLNTDLADFIVELKINKFWTHYSYYGACSWMSMNFAVCDPRSALRTVTYGKKLSGLGYWLSLFTPLVPTGDTMVSVNTAFALAFNQLDKELRSPEFLAETASLARSTLKRSDVRVDGESLEQNKPEMFVDTEDSDALVVNAVAEWKAEMNNGNEQQPEPAPTAYSKIEKPAGATTSVGIGLGKYGALGIEVKRRVSSAVGVSLGMGAHYYKADYEKAYTYTATGNRYVPGRPWYTGRWETYTYEATGYETKEDSGIAPMFGGKLHYYFTPWTQLHQHNIFLVGYYGTAIGPAYGIGYGYERHTESGSTWDFSIGFVAAPDAEEHIYDVVESDGNVDYEWIPLLLELGYFF